MMTTTNLSFGVFDHDSVAIFVQHDYVYAEWTGYQLRASVPNGCSEILRLLTTNKLTKVLNNSAHSKGLWDTDWVADIWFPQMIAAGLTKFAWIVSPDDLCAGETSKVMSDTSAIPVIKAFDNIVQAREWLKM